MIAIAISIVSLVISVIAYLRKSNKTLNWKYTKEGIEFYDETGKKILIKAEE